MILPRRLRPTRRPRQAAIEGFAKGLPTSGPGDARETAGIRGGGQGLETSTAIAAQRDARAEPQAG